MARSLPDLCLAGSRLPGSPTTYWDTGLPYHGLLWRGMAFPLDKLGIGFSCLGGWSS
jgi:hypothetical protein